MSDEATGAAGFAGPQHGTFCWTEIGVKDAARCKEYYSSIFGWTWQDSNASDGPFAYHEFSTGGPYPAGGLYEIVPEMCEDPNDLPPPHFMTYISVDDVDAYAAKAAELGGTVIREPMDIPNTGRFATLEDPTGAVFSIFTMQEAKS